MRAWRTAALLAVGTVVVGCSGPTPTGAAPTSAAVETSATIPALTPVGVPVEVASTDGRTITLRVTAIQVTPTCPGRATPVQRADLGVFVVLDVEVHVPGRAGGAGDELPFSAEELSLVGPDGRRQPISSTEASWACFEDDDLIGPFIGGGEAVSGKVVLDSASADGVVVLEIPDGGSAAWAYGAPRAGEGQLP